MDNRGEDVTADSAAETVRQEELQQELATRNAEVAKLKEALGRMQVERGRGVRTQEEGLNQRIGAQSQVLPGDERPLQRSRKKYYVITKGRAPGIYIDFNHAWQQISAPLDQTLMIV